MSVLQALRCATLHGAHPCHICTCGTGLTRATSAPVGLGSPVPHLHRDWAHPCHICTGTGRRRTASRAVPQNGCREEAVPCAPSHRCRGCTELSELGACHTVFLPRCAASSLQVSLEMAAMGRERGIERQRDELRFEPHDSSSGPSSKANSVQRATRGPPHRRNVQRAPSTRGPSS
jgi:hypothetical protein